MAERPADTCTPDAGTGDVPIDGVGAADARTAELAAALDAVRARIARAAAGAGRADVPELIVVTKTHPAADVARLARLGVRDVGENRDQEARPKAAEVAEALGADAPRWHFIGQLQTNKAKLVVRYASAVHSVDRVELADALSRAVVLRREREGGGADGVPDLECLVQVDVDPRSDDERPEGIGPRGGASPEDASSIAGRIAAAEGLALRGLMCVAPRGLDAEESFRRLARLGRDLRAAHPEAERLSMGMSGDLEAAVRAGATHVRIGSDVLGARGAVG